MLVDDRYACGHPVREGCIVIELEIRILGKGEDDAVVLALLDLVRTIGVLRCASDDSICQEVCKAAALHGVRDLDHVLVAVG